MTDLVGAYQSNLRQLAPVDVVGEQRRHSDELGGACAQEVERSAGRDIAAGSWKHMPQALDN